MQQTDETAELVGQEKGYAISSQYSTDDAYLPRKTAIGYTVPLAGLSLYYPPSMYLSQPDWLRRQSQLFCQPDTIFFDSGPIITDMGGKIQTRKGPRTHPASSEGCQRLDMCWG